MLIPDGPEYCPPPLGNYSKPGLRRRHRGQATRATRPINLTRANEDCQPQQPQACTEGAWEAIAEVGLRTKTLGRYIDRPFGPNPGRDSRPRFAKPKKKETLDIKSFSINSSSFSTGLGPQSTPLKPQGLAEAGLPRTKMAARPEAEVVISHAAPRGGPFEEEGGGTKGPPWRSWACSTLREEEEELLSSPGTKPPRAPSAKESVRTAERPSPGDSMVPVVFPGPVSREGCCRFVCELLKHIMYQRQQLPLPYEQLALFYRKPPPQAEDVARRKARAATEPSSRKCQQALAELEGLMSHLERFFSRTPVPRVLILLGGSALNPKEFYELDLARLSWGGREGSLSTPACLRRLFRALFLADAFSELQAAPAMSTVVMAQGHRECGEDWLCPKLNYRVPTRGHKLTLTLSSEGAAGPDRAWDDYVWFQAPVTLRGFRE
ncbi:MAD2L1-binding protein [Tachyglossus aculeatus]|uniref:MAD2L1-binding protein n=1 Tax=Tachyglossus aculeatus TaxID=9261 RepID=UPI0018F44EEA|nr:MAD2L1-binding protein [Tachyglossus aculeatus]